MPFSPESLGRSVQPCFNFCLTQVAGGSSPDTPVIGFDWRHATANEIPLAPKNFYQQISEAGEEALPIFKRTPLENDKSKIWCGLIALPDEFATEASMLRRMFGDEDANTFDWRAKYLGEELAGAQQQRLDTRLIVLAPDQMKIQDRHDFPFTAGRDAGRNRASVLIRSWHLPPGQPAC